MNGNDYVEIAEAHDMQIIKDYVNDIIDGKEDVPDEFKNKWVDSYLEGD